MPKIAIVSGCSAKSSRLTGLTDYCLNYLQSRGIETEVLYPIDLPAERLLRADFADPSIKEAVALVERADAVILASPVYKAAYSGVLKLFIDMLPQKGLQNKKVFPLFIGGTIAHLLSIDYALKPVISALGGTHILQGVYAVDQWVNRLEAGGFELKEEVVPRLREALQSLLQELGESPSLQPQ
ncbi:NADPH-dependent FMN reductase [Cohnella sp. AR92]|uniref:NADPH-dependent FMN reductase n=1 Tax=Cohnella sp. AR92 TaxID=648716 RepID=UPI000F8DFE41|nr:NADPH-dependent FMN reductase [Cohnella sp. AR92]RUS45564.1 FMN reductase (NADPH) [Cohnella sp. AR92]